MMNEIEQKPSLRFKGFVDAWEQCELWSLTTWDKEFNEVEKEKQLRIIKYPYVLADKLNSLEDNSGKVLLLSTGTYVGFTTEEKAGSNLCEGEVVAIPWGGTPNIKYWSGKFVTADNRIATSNDIQKLRNKFIYYWMNNQISNVDKIYRGASIKHPSMNDILSMNIQYPKISEQDKISTTLTNIDSLITLHQRKHKKLVTLKTSLLERMFPKNGANTPEIRFKGLVDAWELRLVKELFKVTRGYVLPATVTSPSKSLEAPYPVYSSQTQNNGLMGYYKDFLFENAITWTTDGANAGTVRYRAEKFYSTNVNGVLLSEKGYANQAVSEALNSVAWKYVSHVGNPKLMNNVMSEIPIAIPKKISEQNQISRLLMNFDQLITLHQRKLEKLQNIKKSLLSLMFVS